MNHRPRVLVLTHNYPTIAQPTRGLWAERLVHAAACHADQTVIAPVSWRVRLPREGPRRGVGGADVWHPTVPGGLTYYLHAIEVLLDTPTIRRLADRLHAERPFDLIHAHFIYPDGVIAARLGRRYGIPVVTTEHAFWRPWLDAHPRVRAQVMRAVPDLAVVTAVSERLRVQVDDITRGMVRTAVLPNVVDDATFVSGDGDVTHDPDRLLFVGLIRHVKGLDVLVRALGHLAHSRPALRLRVVGDATLFRGYAVDARRVHRLIADLGLNDRITFLGALAPRDVASEMQRSGLVVVASRRETFSSATVEALACGTPVVATRCGGPEEIITPDDGVLAPVDDPVALARAITDALDRHAAFDPASMRARAVARFGPAAAAQRLATLYGEVLGDHGGPLTTPRSAWP